PTGFAFVANQGKRQVGVMGDEIKLAKGLQLRIVAPVAGTIRLFRNGKLVRTAEAQDFSYPLTEAGTYRAEVWLTLDGEARPWIYANPIRVL
ncbi:MAG: histidinol phosphatase, partial [Acidobacteria bacterium]|nr:histidinol phosphatase [Acidobacteriota bacterium]